MSGQFAAMFSVTEPDVILALTKRLLCLNLTKVIETLLFSLMLIEI